MGLNVVVGEPGLLDLRAGGYVVLWAVGAYPLALLTSPSCRWREPAPDSWLSTDWAWLACASDRGGDHRHFRSHPRVTRTCGLRGDYLRHRHARLWRDLSKLLADNLTEITGGGRGLAQVAYPRLRGPARGLPARAGVFSAGNAGST